MWPFKAGQVIEVLDAHALSVKVAALEIQVAELKEAAHVRYYDPDSYNGVVGCADHAPVSTILAQVLVHLRLHLAHQNAQPAGHAVRPLAKPTKT